MKPPVGSRVASDGKTGTVKAHRPGSMVDVRWDDKTYDMRTDSKTLTVVRENSGGKFKPVFVAAVLDDAAKQELYNYWVAQRGAPRPLPVPKMSHMTIKFRPSAEEVASMPIGQPVQLRVTGWAANDQIQAVAVEPVGVGSANAAPHVTFALADASVAPKLSNDLFAGAATSGQMSAGPVITATLGWSDGGKYYFSVPGVSSNPGPRGGLTQGERGGLPDSAFALSGRRFPINDRRHAVIAMQYILRGFVRPQEIEEILSQIAQRYPQRDRRNAEIWAFYTKHKAKLSPRVAANPKEDAYDPAKEQFRAVVQGVYESQVRKELGLPHSTAFEANGRRLDAPLDEEAKRRLLSSAYAIATRQGQKYGYLKEGTQTPTEKGMARSAQRLVEREHAGENRQDYERTLAAVRKSGHYRVVEERTESNRRVFVVQPRPPKGLIKIPDYRLSQAAAEQDARDAETALANAPRSVKAKANPYYAIRYPQAVATFDIPDGDDVEIGADETLQSLSDKTGISPQILFEEGVVEGFEPGRLGYELKTKSGKLAAVPLGRLKPEEYDLDVVLTGKKLSREKTAQTFESRRPVIDFDIPEGQAGHAVTSRSVMGPGYIELKLKEGETLSDLVKRGVPKADLQYIHDSMANFSIDHFDFLLGGAVPTLREVYFRRTSGEAAPTLDEKLPAREEEKPGRVAAADRTDFLDPSARSIFTVKGVKDRYGKDLQEILKAYSNLVAWAMTGGNDEPEMGDYRNQFVYGVKTPEGYQNVSLSDLLKRPPPPGIPVVDALKGFSGGARKNEWVYSFPRLRVPYLWERLYFVSPSAILLAGTIGAVGINMTGEQQPWMGGQGAIVVQLADGNHQTVTTITQDPLGVYVEGESYLPIWTLTSPTAGAPSEVKAKVKVKDFAERATMARRVMERASKAAFDLRGRGVRSAVDPSLFSHMLPDVALWHAEAAAFGLRLVNPALSRWKFDVAGGTVPVAPALRGTPDTFEQYRKYGREFRTSLAVPRGVSQDVMFQMLRAEDTLRTASTALREIEARISELSTLIASVPAEHESARDELNVKLDIQLERRLVAETKAAAAQESLDGAKPSGGGIKWSEVTALSAIVRQDVDKAADHAAWHFDLVRVLETKKQSLADRTFDLKPLSGGQLYTKIMTGKQAEQLREISGPRLLKYGSKATRDSAVQQEHLPAARKQANQSYIQQRASSLKAKAKILVGTLRTAGSGGSPVGVAELKRWTPQSAVSKSTVNLYLDLMALIEGFRSLVKDPKFSADDRSSILALAAETEESINAAGMTKEAREARVAELETVIPRLEAQFKAMYETEKAQGKHEAKVRGLASDRKDNPSDIIGQELRGLKDELTALDPTYRGGTSFVSEPEIAARRALVDFSKPSHSSTEDSYNARGIPLVVREGFYTPSPSGPVWVPGRLIPADGSEPLPTFAGPSPLESFLDRMELTIQSAEADGAKYPIAVVQMPQRVTADTLSCGPLVGRSAEVTPVVFSDPKNMLPGVRPDYPVKDPGPRLFRAGFYSIPDAVMAYLYFQDEYSPVNPTALQKRLQRVLSSAVTQEITLNAFTYGDAPSMRDVREGFDQWLADQMTVFRLPSLTALGELLKLKAAEKVSIVGRGFPMPVYLYAGMDSAEARKLSANRSTALVTAAAPLLQRAILSAKTLEQHLTLMAKYPRFPSSRSLVRGTDGNTLIQPVVLPETKKSLAEEEARKKDDPGSKYSFFPPQPGIRSITDLVALRAPKAEIPSPSSYRLFTMEKDLAMMEAEKAAAAYRAILKIEGGGAAEIQRLRADDSMRVRSVPDRVAGDFVDPSAYLVQADAITTLAAPDGAGSFRTDWLQAVEALRSSLGTGGGQQTQALLSELDAAASVGSREDLLDVVGRLRGAAARLPDPKSRKSLEKRVEELSDVVVRADGPVQDASLPDYQLRTARKVSKAKSMPAPKQRLMITQEENLPPVFWDVEADRDGEELYVLFLRRDKFQRLEFAKSFSGALMSSDLLTGNITRTRPSIGGSSGERGETSEVIAIRKAISDAQARNDRPAILVAQAKLTAINQRARAHRDAVRGYHSPLVVTGKTNAQEGAEARLSAFAVPESAVNTISPEERALFEPLARKYGKSVDDIIAAQRARQQALFGIEKKARGGKALKDSDPRRGWVFNQRRTQDLIKADKQYDEETAGYVRFGFSLSKYMRFETKNPLVALATILYWEAPELVTGTVLLLPGGANVTVPGVYTVDPDAPPSGTALPYNPSTGLTDLIEEVKTDFLRATERNDFVAQAQIVRMLFGEQRGRGGQSVPGLVAIAEKFHSASGNHLPSRAEIPYLSGTAENHGKLAIEGAHRVGFSTRFPTEAPLPFKDTRLGRMMSKNSQAEINKSRRAAYEAEFKRHQSGQRSIEADPARAVVIAGYTAALVKQAPKLEDLTAGTKVPYSIGDRVRVLAGGQNGATATVLSVIKNELGAVDLVLAVDPFGRRTQAMEMSFEDVQDGDLEFLEARPQSIQAPRLTADETRGSGPVKAVQAQRARAARFNVDDEFIHEGVPWRVVEVITRSQPVKYDLVMIDPLTFEPLLDDNDEQVTDTFTEDDLAAVEMNQNPKKVYR